MSHNTFFLSKLTKLEFVRQHATLTKKNHWQEPWWDHGEGTCTAHHVEMYLFLFAWRQQDAACSCITTETAESSLQWQGGAKGEWGVGSSHRIPSFSLDFHKLSMQFQKCGQSKMSQLYAYCRQKRPTFTERNDMTTMVTQQRSTSESVSHPLSNKKKLQSRLKTGSIWWHEANREAANY